MLVMALGLLVQDAAEWRPGPSDMHQSSMDADAERMARRVRGDISTGPSEPLPSRVSGAVASVRGWRPITDAEMRECSGYYAPVGYHFRRMARTDLDRDGRADVIEMVTDERRGGLRVTYGARVKPPRLIARFDKPWCDQALLAAGPHAVMINQPEVNVYFVFQRGDAMRAHFVGD
ncbi:hypothetical protein [Sphingomonas sp.]|uniref:hypothetical protein n=1 Tax=Sphingomonas sp. TaxID=28214 RepID=UPI0035C87001